MKIHLWLFVLIILLSILFVGGKSQKNVNMCAPQYVSAFPGPVEIQQPDGTPLTIVLSGDEFLHYTRTVDGYTLLQDEKGFYRYAKINAEGNMVISNIIAGNPGNGGIQKMTYLQGIKPGLQYSGAQIRGAHMRRFGTQRIGRLLTNMGEAFPTVGTHKFPVILVDFSDKPFVKTNADFNALYNTNTISFRNYNLATSYNLLTVDTTVVGPYNLPGTMATYGANDEYGYDINPRLMVQVAIDAAEAAGLNFAEFDNDGNGYIDGIQVVHAGFGEEAGAPAETIWSHRWTLGPYARTYDGVTIDDYSTVPELYGAKGSTITGVGVLAHEFGHNLGCPDTYDTDYSSSGGTAWDTKKWDIMGSGSWNNNGNNPPLHNPYARWKLGWLTPTTVSPTSNLTLNAAAASPTIYKYDTTTADEYFLLENRQQTGDWDYYLPGHGMLIWHIDGPWISSHSANDINVTPTHQGIDVEEADDVRTCTTYAADPFAGSGTKTAFTDNTTPNAKSWAGANTNKPITNIVESDGVITCTMSGNAEICTAQSTNSSYEWISRVRIGSINKSSGASYYSDFTSTSTDMSRGKSVSVALNTGYKGTIYFEHWKVWIDYNKNYSFAETNETVFSKSGKTYVTGSFTCLPTAGTGTTTMRVAMKYGSYPSYCGTFHYGEVEDYSVNIL